MVLIEREQSLTVLRATVRRASEGTGSSVVIDGPPGTGKSALLDWSADAAGQAGLTVLRARGSILERDLPWAVAAQLMRPVALSRAIASSLEPTPAAAEGTVTQIARGLVAALADLVTAPPEAGGGPLVVVVDDAHWVDSESLRFLAHLAQRGDTLPVGLMIATRSGEPLADARAERALGDCGRRLRPSALSDAGASELVVGRFPQADPALGAECARLTGGNPGLLSLILDQLDESPSLEAGAATALLSQVPARVREAVGARLEELAPTDRRIAQSVAVLGAEATMLRVARLSAVDGDAVLRSADALARCGLLAPELPLALTPPLVQSAVHASLPPFVRALAHLRAAQILRDQHEDPEAIADHLLRAPPSEDGAMVAVLREAAQRAAADDDLERASTLLMRAIAERPGVELRLALLTELAQAQAGARELTVGDRLHDVRQPDSDPIARARLALAQGEALYAHGQYTAAARILAAGADELDGADPALHDALCAVRVSCASWIGGLLAEALTHRDRLLAQPVESLSPTERAAIAHTVVHDALGGATRARVRQIAEAAWGDGALLDAGPTLRLGVPLLCTALLIADDVERATEILTAAQEAPPNRWIAAGESALACVRAWALYLQGNVAEALGGAMDVLRDTSRPDPIARPAAQVLIVACRVERDRVDAAERLLGRSSLAAVPHPAARALWLEIRARVRFAQHRPQEALQDALEAGVALGGLGSGAAVGLVTWRSTAALALLSLGDDERAQALVREELSQATALGNQRVMTRDLRVLGLSLAGDGLDALARAVEVGDLNGPRLEHIEALVDHGAALRRLNNRAKAREPLRAGLDLSHRGGATVLAERARAELAAAGARPRRAAATGVASLTASQQRVAEMAASGLTTRQIAETLFVTPKTVEFHLSQTYRKLDINSRAHLAEVLRSA